MTSAEVRAKKNLVIAPLIRQQPMVNDGRCLQERTGSCMGCPVQDIAAERIRREGVELKAEIIQKIERSLCPEGNQMQEPPRVLRSTW